MVDMRDSKSLEHYARAGSSPARGTRCMIALFQVYTILAVIASSGLVGVHSW